MATRTIIQPRYEIVDEPQEVSIDITLSGQDLVNVRRILEGKYEPEVNARLVVKVRPK